MQEVTEEDRLELERERDRDERDALVERMMDKDKSKTKQMELGGLTPAQVCWAVGRSVGWSWVSNKNKPENPTVAWFYRGVCGCLWGGGLSGGIASLPAWCVAVVVAIATHV